MIIFKEISVCLRPSLDCWSYCRHGISLDHHSEISFASLLFQIPCFLESRSLSRSVQSLILGSIPSSSYLKKHTQEIQFLKNCLLKKWLYIPLHVLLKKKKIFFCWSTVDLQCCVSFRCTTKCDSVIRIHIFILFQILFSCWLSQNIEQSSLCSRSLLVICCIQQYVCINPKLLIYPSSPRFPFGNCKFVFDTCKSVFVQ